MDSAARVTPDAQNNSLLSYVLVLVSTNIAGAAALPARAFYFALAGAFFGGFAAIASTFARALRISLEGRVPSYRAHTMLVGVLVQWVAIAGAFLGMVRFFANPIMPGEVGSWWTISKVLAVDAALIAAFLQISSTGRSRAPLYALIGFGAAFALLANLVV